MIRSRTKNRSKIKIEIRLGATGSYGHWFDCSGEIVGVETDQGIGSAGSAGGLTPLVGHFITEVPLVGCLLV